MIAKQYLVNVRRSKSSRVPAQLGEQIEKALKPVLGRAGLACEVIEREAITCDHDGTEQGFICHQCCEIVK